MCNLNNTFLERRVEELWQQGARARGEGRNIKANKLYMNASDVAFRGGDWVKAALSCILGNNVSLACEYAKDLPEDEARRYATELFMINEDLAIAAAQGYELYGLLSGFYEEQERFVDAGDCAHKDKDFSLALDMYLEAINDLDQLIENNEASDKYGIVWEGDRIRFYGENGDEESFIGDYLEGVIEKAAGLAAGMDDCNLAVKLYMRTKLPERAVNTLIFRERNIEASELAEKKVFPLLEEWNEYARAEFLAKQLGNWELASQYKAEKK